MQKVTFYHAGCPVCLDAEQHVLNMVDKGKFEIEIIHLGNEKNKIPEAENLGIKSVPALVLENSNVLHINFGASINDLKN